MVVAANYQCVRDSESTVKRSNYFWEGWEKRTFKQRKKRTKNEFRSEWVSLLSALYVCLLPVNWFDFIRAVLYFDSTCPRYCTAVVVQKNTKFQKKKLIVKRFSYLIVCYTFALLCQRLLVTSCFPKNEKKLNRELNKITNRFDLFTSWIWAI